MDKQIFETIKRLKSVSQKAKEEGVTTPAIRKRIKKGIYRCVSISNIKFIVENDKR